MLLAFKPFYFDCVNETLLSYYSSELEWPNRIVTAPCKKHSYFSPIEDCTCGMTSTLSLVYAKHFYVFPGKDSDSIVPVLATVQVLGKAIIEDDLVRSWGVFLYSIVLPKYGGPPYDKIAKATLDKYRARISSVPVAIEMVVIRKSNL